MWYGNLFKELELLKDETKSQQMMAYMQNKFVFLGIPKPKLSEFIKPFFKESRKQPIDWKFIDLCYSNDYREAQYIAIEYLKINRKKIIVDDFNHIKKLIINKSWWETVDNLDAIIGDLVLKDRKLEEEMLNWSFSDNLWLRRVSIDFQQQYKDKTNEELLTKVIINNLGSKDFFINKAIGWSLREYSKTNPIWVKNFVDNYKDKMDKLSIKEATKYIS